MNRRISFKFAAPLIAALIGGCGWGYYRYMKIELHAPGPIEGRPQPPSATAGLQQMLASLKTKTHKAKAPEKNKRAKSHTIPKVGSS